MNLFEALTELKKAARNEAIRFNNFFSELATYLKVKS
jgi:hypothetical protein